VTLTLVGQNNVFVPQALQAPAGRPISVTFDNRDTVVHNVRFYGGPTSSSPSIGATPLSIGPSVDTVLLGELAPGSYYFRCDTHPTTMTGTLTVN
jgi:plastocyanin